MVFLDGGNVQEELNQLLRDEVLMIKKEVLDSEEDDRIHQDSSIKQMSVAKLSSHTTMRNYGFNLRPVSNWFLEVWQEFIGSHC